MSQEFPNENIRPEFERVLSEAIEKTRQQMLNEEIEVIESIIISKLSSEEKETARVALYSRLKPERERFLDDLREEFLIKAPAISPEQMTPTLLPFIIKRHNEYLERVTRVIDTIYSEFKID